MEVIPAIDLRGGKCVRLVQGDYARERVFDDDPVAVARRWTGAGATRLHVVDLDGARSGVRLNDPAVKPEPVLDFTSGYVQRALHTLPSQGSKQPWRLYQNYIKDIALIRRGSLEDGTMEFK